MNRSCNCNQGIYDPSYTTTSFEYNMPYENLNCNQMSYQNYMANDNNQRIGGFGFRPGFGRPFGFGFGAPFILGAAAGAALAPYPYYYPPYPYY